MNKTITCNIAGLVFNVEEQAYEKLNAYLKAVKNTLINKEGGEEVYADIEGRVAEIFTERLSSRQEVVLEKDVEYVITAMGEPQDFILDDDYAKESYNPKIDTGFNTNKKSEKTLMRDTDNGVIAGVCSGLSAYLGWDVVFVRILFLLALFLTGFGFIVYIVLWIAAPEAKSSTDRLRMRGEPITLDTISQEVAEAVERVERYAHSAEAKLHVNKIKNSGKKVGNAFTKAFGGLLAMGAFIGITLFLVFSLTNNGFFIDDDGENFVSLYHMSTVIFSSPTQSFMGWSGLLLIVILPMLFLGIYGIVLLLAIQQRIMGRVFLTFLSFWIVGLIFFFFVSFQVGRDFTHHEYVEKHEQSIDAKSLNIFLPKDMGYGDNDDFFEYLSHDGKTIKNAFVKIELTSSDDSLFHIVTRKYASGVSKKKAYRRIDNIKHSIIIDSNLVNISPVFEYPIDDCLRRQKVLVRIEVPQGADVEWLGEVKSAYVVDDKRNGKIID
jgi:phage shock protein PspC (stress-responsive transcriptional regulator)